MRLQAGRYLVRNGDLVRLTMRVLAFVLMILLRPISAYGDSFDTLLESVSSYAADDGSVRITLNFNRRAPDTRIIRSDERTVHVVMINTSIGKRAHADILNYGELVEGSFAGFAGIGLRLDLRMRDRVPLRLDPIGNSLVVHIPATRSDLEAGHGPVSRIQPRFITPPAPARIATATDRVTMIVKLSYADVSEVAGALVKGAIVPSNDVFTATSPFSPPTQSSTYSSGSGGSRDIPPPPTPTYVTIPAATLLPKDTPQGVRFDEHVAVDRRLNAVILTGTQAEVDVLRAMVAQMDVPTPSVLLETQIVELTVSAAKDLGLDYSPNGSTISTANFGVASGSKPNISLNMSATVAALEQTGQAKILARPRILSLNNRPAAILSGEAVPIFTSIITGNPSVVQQQVQYINVGVSLQILPRIAYDGKVTTQIFCEVSSIIDFVQNTPRIAVRQELTSAVVNDSESLIVGGLLQENEIRNLKKVPGLGNLPLVGGFFRDISNSSQNTNLYIVITPHILTNGATANSAYDLPSQPQPLPTIPPPDPALVPGEMATPPPAPR